MNDPEDKKNKTPESKPGVSPGSRKPHPEVAPEPRSTEREGAGTIVEVAPEAKRQGPIREMAPDVGKVRPEIAPELGRGIHPEVAPEVKAPHSTLHLLYGPTIHDAVASGNLLRMKEVAREADRQLGQWGDLRTSLEILKVEIAKLEYKQGNK